jgi:hypothetical protein
VCGKFDADNKIQDTSPQNQQPSKEKNIKGITTTQFWNWKMA